MKPQVTGQRVELKPYRVRELRHVEILSDADLYANVGGQMTFDSEIYRNYFLIAFKCLQSGKYVFLEKSPDKSFNVRFLSWILHNYTVIGFNSANFDIGIVWLAYANPDTEVIYAATRQMIFGGMSPYDLQKEFGFQIYPTRHIDLIQICPITGSLKTYGARLHAPRLQDLPFDVAQPITQEQAPIVCNYCVNDLDTTELIARNLAEQLQLRNDISQQYRADLMSKSDPQLAEAMIANELQRVTGKRPYPPKDIGGGLLQYKVPPFVSFQTPLLQNVLRTVASAEYTIQGNGYVDLPAEITALKIQIGQSVYRMGNGGLHSSEKSIGHVADDTTSIVDRDVASYYPAIILNQNLYPKHLGEAFLTVYRDIFERRLVAKKAKNAAVSESLKIAINGCFGKLGSPYSIFYSPDLLIQVTVTGQLCLLMLIEAIELAGVPVVSANTDGMVYKCPITKRDRVNDIVAAWEKHTGFITEETEYSAIYSRDVNNYIAIKKPDKSGNIEVKSKGAYSNPWGVEGDAFKKTAIFRFHKNPMTTICIEAAIDLITKKIPIVRTIENCKDIRKFVAVKNVPGGSHKDGEYVGKVARWYYAKGVYGAIQKIKDNHTVAESEGAKPCQDLPEHFPNDIDFGWYVRRTIRILEELGYLNPVNTLF